MDSPAPDSDPSALAMRFRAGALMDAKRPGDAILVLLRLAATDPNDAQTFCLLSLAYLQVNQPRDALHAANSAVALTPSAEWPHRLRSSALLKLGQKKEALAAAKEAVGLAPNLPECHILLAEAEVANGRLREARVAAERARDLAPDRPGGHVMLSMVAAQAGRWTDVEQHARTALSIDPEDTAALNNLGVALQKLGYRREAVHYLGTASRIDPRNPLYKRNAVRAASRFWAPAVILVLFIGLQVAGGNVILGLGLAAMVIAGRTIVYITQGRLGANVRTPLKRWTNRRTPRQAHRTDPKASPDLMSALRKERRAQRSGPRPVRIGLLGVVATFAVFFGIGFTVQAAMSTRGAGDVALNAASALFCGAVTFLMFRWARRPRGGWRRWRRRDPAGEFPDEAH